MSAREGSGFRIQPGRVGPVDADHRHRRGDTLRRYFPALFSGPGVTGRGGAERGRGENVLRGRKVLGCRGGRCARCLAESSITDVPLCA